MDDYYVLLGAERTASPKELEKLIRSQLRTWSKRSNHPDLSRRQEAERRVQQLGEARRTLLDAGRRAEYDRRLALEPASRPPPDVRKAADIGWLDEAKRHLVAGDYRSAVYAARQARDADPGDAETWSVLARANAEVGNLNDALYETGRAVELEPGEARNHVDLADVQAQMDMPDRAIASLRRALELDPGLEEAHVGLAFTLQETGQHAEALRILEELLPHSQEPEWLGDQLGAVLITAAEAVPRVQWADAYAVTAPNEVAIMRTYLDRVRQVAREPEILAAAGNIEQQLAWCTARHWRSPSWMGNGCVISAGIVGLLVTGLISLAVLSSGDVLDILTMLLFWAGGIAGISAIVYFTAFTPGWKINQIAHSRPPGPPGPW